MLNSIPNLRRNVYYSVPEIYTPTSPEILDEVYIYGAQYNVYYILKTDSYVIEKDLYVTIRQLQLILYKENLHLRCEDDIVKMLPMEGAK
jgi:hypothetical protein